MAAPAQSDGCPTMAARPECVSQILMNIVLNISWKCEAWHIPVILQAAGALAFLSHPSHLLE